MPINMTKDPSGKPAVDLSKVAADLRPDAEVAQSVLQEMGLAGLRMEFEGWGDHSVSMSGDYSSGRVQGLCKRCLAGVLPVDNDGKMPFTAWDSKLHTSMMNRSPVLTLANYERFVDKDLYKPSKMGGTVIMLPLSEIAKRAAKKPNELQGHIIFTDGQPQDGEEALQFIGKMSYDVPNAHLTVVSLRPKKYGNDLLIPWLDDIDNMETRRPDVSRKTDNVTCAYLPNYDTMPARDFYRAIYAELDTWIAQVTA